MVYTDAESGEGLTDEEIAGVVLCVLFISTETTAGVLTNVLADLALHPEHLEKATEERETFLGAGDYKGLPVSWNPPDITLTPLPLAECRIKSKMLSVNFEYTVLIWFYQFCRCI